MKTRDSGSTLVKPHSDPDLIYDCASGSFRRKGERAIKTAVDIAMHKVEAPPPPPLELPAIEPLHEDVERQASCNGQNRDHARHQLRERNKVQQARQRIVSPAFAVITEDLHGKGVQSLTEAAERVRVQAQRIGELENKLKERAQLRSQVVADGESLKAAVAALEAPTSLDLPDEKLVNLNNQARHLPSRITETQQRVARLTAEIIELAKAGDISIPALVDDLYKCTGPQPGDNRISDRSLRSLIESGFLTL